MNKLYEAVDYYFSNSSENKVPVDYFINDRKVTYSSFRYYLLRATKMIVLNDEDNFGLSEYQIAKLADELFWDYYNEMRYEGTSYEMNKLEFKIRPRSN